MKELAIGEEAVVCGYHIRCVEDFCDKDCLNKCCFHYVDDLCCNGGMSCTPSSREDGKNVHFELVEE